MAQTEQNISLKDAMELMKQMVIEIKKPSAEEQAKIDEKKARDQERARQSIENAKRESRQREIEQAVCSHMKPHPYQGKTRIVAPLHNDGLHHPRCLFCHKEFKPFAPAPETIPMGMSMDDLNGVTPQIIEHWGNQHEQKVKNSQLVAELVK